LSFKTHGVRKIALPEEQNGRYIKNRSCVFFKRAYDANRHKGVVDMVSDFKGQLRHKTAAHADGSAVKSGARVNTQNFFLVAWVTGGFRADRGDIAY
jgi:hypothetical protein